MKALIVGFLLLFSPITFAQLKLIPTPQKVDLKEGRLAVANVDQVPVRIAHVDQAKSDEWYQLIVSPAGIEIRCSNAAGEFYARQTLKQLIRANSDANHSIPCCEITDWPALKYRVWQDDISRGPIPTMDFLKREVRTLSELKYNAMTLYTEHVFKLKKHPDIAPDDGITADQIKELAEYAKQYHVELIGNFQSFGHMAHILSLPAYKDLGDNGWNISPAKEESYKFLGDCYSEVAPAYESKLFDINCDEVSLGKEGASKEMVKKLGLAEVYARHINRCCELLRPYGKTVMMWGDIAVEHQDIVPKLPKDLIVLSWGYGAQKSFDDAIEPFTKTGLRFMVCPGVSCWNRIFPDLKTAQINIANYVRDGAKHGAIGMINTSWDDDGENFFSQTWYPFAWGAEMAWNPIDDKSRETRQKDFDQAFAPIFYGAPDDAITKLLWRLSELRSNPASGNLEDRLFWRDYLLDSGENSRVEDAAKLASDASDIASALSAAKSSAKLNADTIDYAIFAARRLALLGVSRQLLPTLREKVRGGGALSDIDHAQIKALVDQLTALRASYADLWARESRPWWLDQILPRYDRQIALIEGVPLRVLFSPLDHAFDHDATVSIMPLSAGGEIRYTSDGSEPSEQSTLYKDPIQIDKTMTIRARHFVSGKSAPIDDSATYRTCVLPASIDTNLQTYEQFGPVNAFDGVRETYFRGTHVGGDVRAGDFFTIKLDTAFSAKRVAVLTGHRDHPDDILQSGVLEISTDGTTFEKIADFKKNGWGEANFDSPRVVKAVRIRATGDQKSWLIIRELTLE